MQDLGNCNRKRPLIEIDPPRPHSVGKKGEKDYAGERATPGKPQSDLAPIANAQTSTEDVQVSTPELIRMLIICAAVLTIQLFA